MTVRLSICLLGHRGEPREWLLHLKVPLPVQKEDVEFHMLQPANKSDCICHPLAHCYISIQILLFYILERSIQHGRTSTASWHLSVVMLAAWHTLYLITCMREAPCGSARVGPLAPSIMTREGLTIMMMGGARQTIGPSVQCANTNIAGGDPVTLSHLHCAKTADCFRFKC